MPPPSPTGDDDRPPDGPDVAPSATGRPRRGRRSRLERLDGAGAAPDLAVVLPHPSSAADARWVVDVWRSVVAEVDEQRARILQVVADKVGLAGRPRPEVERALRADDAVVARLAEAVELVHALREGAAVPFAAVVDDLSPAERQAVADAARRALDGDALSEGEAPAMFAVLRHHPDVDVDTRGGELRVPTSAVAGLLAAATRPSATEVQASLLAAHDAVVRRLGDA